MHWEGQDAEDDPIFSFDGIDYDYIETFGFELVAGRAYDQEISNDEKNYILNEVAIQRIGYDDPIGKPFNMWGREGKIIGVVKDFSYKNATETIAPLILTHYTDFFHYIHVKLNPLNTAGTIKEIKEVWGEFVSQYPLEYNFLNEDFARMYRTEETMGTLFKIFSGFAVFIACLGLLGLSAFAVERRTKEIGIRKVLGASVRGLVIFFVKDFTRWVVIANIIAWPLAYYAMSNWLQNYIFRVDLTISTFIIASGMAFIIAVVTVLFHTLRAANANPAEALKYE